MRDHGWILLLGCAMWAVMLWARYREWRNPTINADACPECQHIAGLDDARKHCPDADHYNGWASDLCRCSNDYHWNYESVTTEGGLN